MPPTDALLEISRLALAGDANGARSYLQVLLRSAPDPDGRDADTRKALARLLIGFTATATAARAARRAAESAPLLPGPAGSLPSVADSVAAEHSLLTRVEMPAQMAAPVLPRLAREAVDTLLQERLAAERLREAGVEPTRSLLLVGPPGVGKTMTARHLAAAIGLPLVTLDLASVMSSFLGQSGQNLRRALELAARSPCVFFIDEIDALAKRRDDPSDVGELKRLVNVLLLELERWPSESLLVAATNHPGLLDHALWRRFDRVVRLPFPGFRARRRILVDALGPYAPDVPDPDLAWCAAATPGQTGADLHQLVRHAIRRSVLEETGAPLRTVLVGAAMARLEERGRWDENVRVAFCRLATTRLGLSQREVARRLGISHVQVGRLLKQAETASRTVSSSVGTEARRRPRGPVAQPLDGKTAIGAYAARGLLPRGTRG